jgi:uncharacterized protein
MAPCTASSAPAADRTAPGPDSAAVPESTGFVNDHAGVMDDEARAKLESFLDQVKQKTGVQFAVLALKSTAPLDPLDYKTMAFQRWFHGNRTSLLLLVALDQRRIAFETGYELEGILPDALEARIIRDEMTPRFRAGDFAGGITAAVLRVSSIIAKDRGVALEWNGRELRYGPGSSAGDGSFPLRMALFVALFILVSIGSAFGRRGRGIRGGGWWWLGPWLGGGLGGGFGGGFGGGGGGGGGFGGFGGGGGFGSGGGGGSGGW